jgi:hypothetical protein
LNDDEESSGLFFGMRNGERDLDTDERSDPPDEGAAAPTDNDVDDDETLL